jgi:hypothetical protein
MQQLQDEYDDVVLVGKGRCSKIVRATERETRNQVIVKVIMKKDVCKDKGEVER